MIGNEHRQRLIDTITLLRVPGIGKERLRRLVDAFGAARRVREATVSALAVVPGVSRSLASRIVHQADDTEAKHIAEKIERLKWAVVFPDYPEYPAPLAEIAQAPPLLFRRGLPPADNKMIAIVGTRHATERGRTFAFNLARSLTEAGITVVSGMAEGIDSAAHAGALDAGGQTVAVWGCSLDYVYPPSNKDLARRIGASGSIYSEYFPGTRPDRAYFPERNRIISGLAAGVVVIEAGRKSGALITAHLALGQGREVFAVPGFPGTASSFGTNELIKQGATLVTSAADIFRELPHLTGDVVARKFRARPGMTDVEKRIVDLCSSDPLQIDQIARATELPTNELTQFLLALEIKGMVRELPGKRFVLTDDLLC